MGRFTRKFLPQQENITSTCSHREYQGFVPHPWVAGLRVAEVLIGQDCFYRIAKRVPGSQNRNADQSALTGQ